MNLLHSRKHTIGKFSKLAVLKPTQILAFALRNLNTEIKPPKDRLNPEPMVLNIGDHWTLERTFTREDVKNFAVAAQDKHPAHLSEDNAKSFYKKDVVYGIFTSSMFSMMIREMFPGAIYLGQKLKFTAPVLVDELVTAKMVVSDIREEKKVVTFKTEVTKEDGSKVAITGEGTFILPQLKVSFTVTPIFKFGLLGSWKAGEGRRR